MTETSTETAPDASSPKRPSTRRVIVGMSRRHNLTFLALAVGVGLLGGYAALALREMIEFFQFLFYGDGDQRALATVAGALPWYVRLAMPIVAGIVIAILYRLVLPDQRAHGIADVIEATHLHAGRLDARQTFLAPVLCALTLGSGGSAGREGPVVHLCAGLASQISRYVRLSTNQRIELLGCAAASGVAASFNAPIAGVLFALEVVVGNYSLYTFMPIVIAAVCGTLVTRAHIGDSPAFTLPEYSAMSLYELPAFALLGVTCAVAAVLFMRGITFTEDVYNRLKIPPYARPVPAGVLVGLTIVFVPEVMGVGYTMTDLALWEQYSLTALLVLIVAKAAATAFTLGGRMGGGVFAPSLCIGALTGGAFGIVAASVFPDLATSYGFYAVIGMGAVAGAVLGAPISTVFMIFELTHNTNATIAVMLATAIASFAVVRVHGRSMFFLQLERRGLDISGGRVRQLLTEVPVRSVTVDDFETIDEAAHCADVRAALTRHPNALLCVVDRDGRLVGTVSFIDMRDEALGSRTPEDVTAREAARPNPRLLAADDTLEAALSLFDRTGDDRLPVVEDRAGRQVVGVVHHKHVLQAYNNALLQARADERGEFA